MGIIRKTFSVATLGRVAYRSKKETRKRAERILDRERKVQAAAEARIAKAEERLRQVASDAAKSGRKMSRKGRKAAKRAGRRAKHAVEQAGSKASDVVEQLAHR